MNRSRTIAVVFSISALVICPTAGASDLALAIEEVLNGPIPEEIRKFRDFELLLGELTDFYDSRDYEPAWIDGGKLSPLAKEILVVLDGAELQGLRPGDYIAGSIAKGPRATEDVTLPVERLARIDVATSASAMRYIKDLHEGRFSPRHLKLGLEIEHRQLQLAHELRRLEASNDPAGLLESYAPQHEGYRLLRQQLGYYRSLADSESWHALDDSKPLREGDRYSDSGELRRRLELTGDLENATSEEGLVYDVELVAAVKRFQARHGLNDDGVIGKDTFAQLNKSWRQRVASIAASLERWRWVPDDIEDSLIVVNVPGFELGAFDDIHRPQEVALDSRVIVGKSYSRFKTPIFKGELRYLDFRPYWNIPRSITRREIAPHLDEPGYLDEHDYEIVSQFGNDVKALPATTENIDKVRQGKLELRQRPGPKNALGEVKFIFPNEHNVYLHSTPAKGLFAKDRRDFSHGCIRVAKPVELAQWVLEDQSDWDRSSIETAMNAGSPTRVFVTRTIPVYILYVTARVNLRDGLLYFYEDIYGLDDDLAAALGYELGSLIQKFGFG
jgi:murein L,D-transpeptidase YcbB/YkuD